jgi:hypothetical protein
VDVGEDRESPDEVERPVVVGQPGGVLFDDAGLDREVGVDPGDAVRVDFDAVELRAGVEEVRECPAGAAAEVEDVLVAPRPILGECGGDALAVKLAALDVVLAGIASGWGGAGPFA